MTSTSGFATADSSLWTPFAIILLILGSLICACAGPHVGWYEGQSGIDGSEDALHPGEAAAASECRHPAQDGRCDSGSGRAAYGVAFHRSLPASHSHRNDSLYAFRRRSDDQFFGVRGFYRQCRPGIGGVNSMANYGDLPAIVKFIFTALMLLGRLEIFGLLQFLLIRWWK